jgi:hypothetical protein
MMGGMGVVYFALDHGNDGRLLPLKLFALNSSLTAPHGTASCAKELLGCNWETISTLFVVIQLITMILLFYWFWN